jgi:hypothetical protein
VHPWSGATIFSAFICAVTVDLHRAGRHLDQKEWVCWGDGGFEIAGRLFTADIVVDEGLSDYAMMLFGTV